MLAGLLTVAGFGLGNVLRGLAMRNWDEAVFGTVLSSVRGAALPAAGDARLGRRSPRSSAPPTARRCWLYVGCGVTHRAAARSSSPLAMTHMEIALAVLVVHTTPLVIFPVSVFVLKNKEELTPRTVLGAILVLSGIGLLALR